MADGQPGGDSVDVPSTPAIPEGHTVISESDLTTLRRQAEQVSGMKGFYDKARRAGFDKADAFDTFDMAGYQEFSELKGSGVDLGKLKSMAQMLTNPGDTGNEKSETPFDIDSIRESLLGEVDKRLGARDAEAEYRQRYSAIGEKVTSFARELLGEGATDREVDIWARGLMSQVWERGKPFDEGHVLRDRFGVELPGDDSLTELFESAKQARVRKEGEELAKLGDKVNKAKPTAAGSSTDKGTPKEANPSEMSTTDVLEAAKQRVKAQMGAR